MSASDIRVLSFGPAYRFAHAGYALLQKYDFKATGEWDIVAADFGELAKRMGC
jgi:hypothetical protein